MTKRPFKNRLNNLSPKAWLKFQKSWFVHNPPPRKKDVLRHPAKFPETLAQEFIEFFTKQGEVVLDPMVGTGSTLIAALRSGRHSVGIELNPGYAVLAEEIVNEEKRSLGAPAEQLFARVIQGDAKQSVERIKNRPDIVIGDLAGSGPVFDYVLTSPPYWDMLRARGAATQRKRRSTPELDVFYSDDPSDLGNEADYDSFLSRLAEIYRSLQPLLKPRRYMTIIVKNVKKGGRIYPLAWDLAKALEDTYTLKDERIWCQDNQRLAPYGMGSAWVSNTFHHYCLQFRNEI
jgi:DNA modification methylase